MASSGTMACVLRRTTDNLIATSRAILGALFLLALWLDPSEPVQYAALTYTLLGTYVIYAFIIAVVVRRKVFSFVGMDVISHGVDMLVFSVIILLTGGSNSPFFVYFIFLLVVSAMRWQWRGTLVTASGVMSIAAAVAWCPPGLIQQEFELNRYLIRLAYFAVVAMLLGYLSSHESKLGSILSRLSSSSHSVGSDLQQLALQTLQQSADIFDATRVMLLWEEQDEPWLHVGILSQGRFEYLREPPETFGGIVAQPFAFASFFCQDLLMARPPVFGKMGDKLEKWEGAPLQRSLQERFGISAALLARWDGEKTAGFLLVLDKPHMNAEDLLVAEIMSQRAADRFDLYFSLQQVRIAAASDERIKLARDLHDGLLQSLTAAALQLETAYRQLQADPQLARERLRQIQGLIVAEQRGLRSQIQQLKPTVAHIPQPVPERLEELATRIERHWGLHVELKTEDLGDLIPPELNREIYFLLHECLVNAAHHAMATSARAVLALQDGDLLKISVLDNGRGFPFRGRYDLDGLNAMHLGPLALKERISRLGGSLILTSTDAGSRIDIALCLAAEGECNVAYNACARG